MSDDRMPTVEEIDRMERDAIDSSAALYAKRLAASLRLAVQRVGELEKDAERKREAWYAEVKRAETDRDTFRRERDEARECGRDLFRRVIAHHGHAAECLICKEPAISPAPADKEPSR